MREECFKHKDQLRFMFNYYSMTGGDVSNDCVFSMTFNQWMHFVNEAGIVDGSGARGCLPADLQVQKERWSDCLHRFCRAICDTRLPSGMLSSGFMHGLHISVQVSCLTNTFASLRYGI